MRKSHVVPTHLRTPETILTIAGLSLSVRQFLLLLLGAALSYNLWLHLAVLAMVPGGQIVRVVMALVPALLSITLAFVRVASRTLDRWLGVVLLYRARPKRLVWRSIRFVESSIPFGEKEKDA